MALNIQQFIDKYRGKRITIPGYSTAECVAAFWAFNREVNKAETYSAVGAYNLWTQDGSTPYVWDTYRRSNAPVWGAWAIWSGRHGAYPNGGLGHVAQILSDNRDGWGQFMTQNPGPFQEETLSMDGIVGYLVPIGVEAGTNGGASVHLPASVNNWKVYPQGVAPVSGNQIAALNPEQYGGLSYAIQGWSQPNVALIDTQMFGRVQIYIGPDTPASIQ